MTKSVFTILLIQAFRTFSQNVLSNGDFEFYSSLPNAGGQISKCLYWDDLVFSPDYFHTSSFLPVYPEYGGTYSNQAMVGLGSDGLDPGGAESIGQDISSTPILSGANCEVGIYSKQETYFYGGCASIELYGFTNPQTVIYTYDYIGDYPGAVLLWSSSNIIDSIWTNYSGTFTSPQTINYVVFTLSSTPNCDHYVYLDSVYINVDGLTIPEFDHRELLVSPNPSSTEATIKLPTSSPNHEFKLFITNSIGQFVQIDYSTIDETIYLDLSEIESGIYLVNLIQDHSVYACKLIVQN
jgi:hypothetical protein